MFNIPEDHNETTGNYAAIDMNPRQFNYDETQQLRRKNTKKLSSGIKSRKSKRNIEVSSGDETPFKESKRKYSK